jgi:hypothetical protein
LLAPSGASNWLTNPFYNSPPPRNLELLKLRKMPLDKGHPIKNDGEDG